MPAPARVSGWYLLGTLGFVVTIRLAAADNLVAAALATLALVALGSVERPGARPEPGVVVPATTRERAWPWFVLYGLTGAVALGLEVVFFRVVDIGCAIGSRLVRRADETRPVVPLVAVRRRSRGGNDVPADRRNEDLFPRDEHWLNNGF